MPIHFACPCGKRLRAPEEMAGKAIRCPACKAVLSVPAVAAVADGKGGEAIEPPPTGHQPEPPPGPSGGSGSKSQDNTYFGIFLLALLIGVFCLCAGGTTYSYLEGVEEKRGRVRMNVVL